MVLLALVVWILLCILVGKFWESRNEPFAHGFTISLFLSPLGGFLIGFLSGISEQPALGIQSANLPTDVRKEIGSNKGVIVKHVLNGTPAFKEDILEGDIIKKVNNKDVIDSESFTKFTNKHAGEKVKFEIIRKGEKIIKEIELREK